MKKIIVLSCFFVFFFVHVTVAGLIDNGDGTVTDTDTGLMWQQEGPGLSMTWKKALEYCEELSFAGYSDWHLPSREELRSIVDYRKYNPAIDTKYFSDIEMSGYWSAATDARYTDYAWCVHFGNGYDYSGSKSGSRYVRGVRSGQAGSFGPLVISVETPLVSDDSALSRTNDHLLYHLTLSPKPSGATLNGITFRTKGTYQTTDITAFKLFYSDDETLDTADTELAKISESGESGANLVFTGLTQTFPKYGKAHLFLTADISSKAGGTRTLSIQAPSLSDIRLAKGWFTAKDLISGGVQTFESAYCEIRALDLTTTDGEIEKLTQGHNGPSSVRTGTELGKQCHGLEADRPESDPRRYLPSL